MIRRSRKRLFVALMLAACLLFQQVSMAAHACTMVQMPAGSVARQQQDCDAMVAEQEHDSQATAACQKDYKPDPATSGNHAPVAIPALSLPPVIHEIVLIQGADRASFTAEVSITRSDPPPRVRYCRLLI